MQKRAVIITITALFVFQYKKRANHKPDSVLISNDKCLSFISTNNCSLALTAYPPTIGRAALKRWFTRRCTS